MFARLKLSTQLLVLVGGTALLTIVLLVLLAGVLLRDAVRAESIQRVQAMALAGADLVAEPLAAGNTAAIERALGAIVRDEGLDRATVFDAAGTILAERSESEEGAERPSDAAEFALAALRDGQLRTRSVGQQEELAVPVGGAGASRGVLVAEAHASDIDDELASALPRLVVAGLVVALAAVLLALALARYIALPIRHLTDAAAAIGRGELADLPVIRGVGEVDVLAGEFGRMVTNLREVRAEVAEQQRMLETRVAERTTTLEQALSDLQASDVVRDQLSAAVRELSSPVVPVLDGILVMPLIGAIDAERARILIESLLHAIEQHRASVIILDVTGVPIVDTHVARALLDAATAVGLLGAQAVLVGLRPELAQTIVGLGLNLSGLVTRANLQSGVSYAIQQRKGYR